MTERIVASDANLDDPLVATLSVQIDHQTRQEQPTCCHGEG